MKILILALLSCLVLGPVFAFDGDFSLTPPRLLLENFLDIKAYEFQAVEERQWQQAPGGFRLTGGSLDKERAYTELDFLLQERLGNSLSVSLEFEQKNYHAPKVQVLPLAELAWRFSAWQVGFLGTPVYDKRQADLGWSLTLGERGKQYLRLSMLSIDHYYNHKNDYDQSRYLNSGYEWKLAAYMQNQSSSLQVNLQRTTDFTYEFDNGDHFNYRDWIIAARGEFKWEQRYIGISLAGDSVNKGILSGAVEDRYRQKFRQLDIYLDKLEFLSWPMTMGIRYDRLVYDFRQRIGINNLQDFFLDTAQLYGIIQVGRLDTYHADLGLYVGRVRTRIDDQANPTNDRNEMSLQAKLRTGLALNTSSSKFSLNISFNLDRLREDPLDGGGITYQRRFE